MPRSKARPSPRKSKWLTSFRCLDGDVVTSTGFGRTLQVSESAAVLESPDAFAAGQLLALEFLLDNNQIVSARAHVRRITKGKGLFRVNIEFEKLPAKTRRLLLHPGAA